MDKTVVLHERELTIHAAQGTVVIKNFQESGAQEMAVMSNLGHAMKSTWEKSPLIVPSLTSHT